ncbi:Uncharacterised protein [Klebsiella oxytoca]|nr:Uncharacterised protein [Klebsiella oxytoca]
MMLSCWRSMVMERMCGNDVRWVSLTYCSRQPAAHRPRGAFSNAESDQIARTELEIELLARGVDFEFPQRTTAQASAPLNQRGFGKVFRVQQFGGIGALELRPPSSRGQRVRSGENVRS